MTRDDRIRFGAAHCGTRPQFRLPRRNDMPRVAPLAIEQVEPIARKQLEVQIARGGRATNMKLTLARSPIALHTYLHWYDLHAEACEFLGERCAMLFAHAISSQTDCLICSTFFRRWLTEAGDNPD